MLTVKDRWTRAWKEEVEAAWPDDQEYLYYTYDGVMVYADVDTVSAGELNLKTGVSVVYGPENYS